MGRLKSPYDPSLVTSMVINRCVTSDVHVRSGALIPLFFWWKARSCYQLHALVSLRQTLFKSELIFFVWLVKTSRQLINQTTWLKFTPPLYAKGKVCASCDAGKWAPVLVVQQKWHATLAFCQCFCLPPSFLLPEFKPAAYRALSFLLFEPEQGLCIVQNLASRIAGLFARTDAKILVSDFCVPHGAKIRALTREGR